MAGKSPYGTVLKCAGVQIAAVADIDGPSLEAEDLDVTDLNSANQFQEYARGQINGGTVTLTLNMLPGNAGHMTTLLEGYGAADPEDAKKSWSVDNDLHGLSLPFDGYVKTWSPKASKGSALALSVTIKVTGKPGFIA